MYHRERVAEDDHIKAHAHGSKCDAEIVVVIA
jgi:hypothetical protein